MNTEDRLAYLEGVVAALVASDRYTFQKHLQFLDGRNIQAGRSVGTKIGTAADQKIGFFGKTPIVQQSAITAPSGGGSVDSQSRTAIGLIITALQNFGLTL